MNQRKNASFYAVRRRSVCKIPIYFMNTIIQMYSYTVWADLRNSLDRSCWLFSICYVSVFSSDCCLTLWLTYSKAHSSKCPVINWIRLTAIKLNWTTAYKWSQNLYSQDEGGRGVIYSECSQQGMLFWVVTAYQQLLKKFPAEHMPHLPLKALKAKL